jgi:hypothetical protein
VSVPGHWQLFQAIADVVLLHRGQGGQIAGALVRIDMGEVVDIAVLCPQ